MKPFIRLLLCLTLISGVLPHAAWAAGVAQKSANPSKFNYNTKPTGNETTVEVKFTRPPNINRDIEVYFILDNSGSMVGKEASVRSWFNNYLNKLHSVPNKVTISIREGGGNTDPTYGPAVLNDSSYKTLQQFIQSWVAFGNTSTEIPRAMSWAPDMFSWPKPGQTDYTLRFIVAMSDGVQGSRTYDGNNKPNWPVPPGTYLQYVYADGLGYGDPPSFVDTCDVASDATGGDAQPTGGNIWYVKQKAFPGLYGLSAAGPYEAKHVAGMLGVFSYCVDGPSGKKNVIPGMYDFVGINHMNTAYNGPDDPVPFFASGNRLDPKTIKFSLNPEYMDTLKSVKGLDKILDRSKVTSIAVQDTLNPAVFEKITGPDGLYQCGTNTQLPGTTLSNFNGTNTLSFQATISTPTPTEYCLRLKAKLRDNLSVYTVGNQDINTRNTGNDALCTTINDEKPAPKECNRVTYLSAKGYPIYWDNIDPGNIHITARIATPDEPAPKRMTQNKSYGVNEQGEVEIKLTKPNLVADPIELAIAYDPSKSREDAQETDRKKLIDFGYKALEYPNRIAVTIIRANMGDASRDIPRIVLNKDTLPKYVKAVTDMTSGVSNGVAAPSCTYALGCVPALAESFNRIKQQFAAHPQSSKYVLAMTDGLSSTFSNGALVCSLVGSSGQPTVQFGKDTRVQFSVNFGTVLYGDLYALKSWTRNYAIIHPRCEGVQSQYPEEWDFNHNFTIIRPWQWANVMAKAYNSPWQPFTDNGQDIKQVDMWYTLDEVLANANETAMILEVHDSLNPDVFADITTKTNSSIDVYDCANHQDIGDATFIKTGPISFVATIKQTYYIEYCLRFKVKLRSSFDHLNGVTSQPINTKSDDNAVLAKGKSGAIIHRQPIERGSITLDLHQPAFYFKSASAVKDLQPGDTKTSNIYLEYVDPSYWESYHRAELRVVAIQKTNSLSVCDQYNNQSDVKALTNGSAAGLTAQFAGNKATIPVALNTNPIPLTLTTTAAPGNFVVCVWGKGASVGGPADQRQVVAKSPRVIAIPVTVIYKAWLQISRTNLVGNGSGDVFSLGNAQAAVPAFSMSLAAGTHLYRPDLTGVVTTATAHVEPKRNQLSSSTPTWLTDSYAVGTHSPLRTTYFRTLATQVDRIIADRPNATVTQSDAQRQVGSSLYGSVTGAGCRPERYDLADAVKLTTPYKASGSPAVVWDAGWDTGSEWAPEHQCPMFIQVGSTTTANEVRDLVISADSPTKKGAKTQSFAQPVIFLVSGSVYIKGDVKALNNVVLMWNGGFSDAYGSAGQSNTPLTIKGALYALPGSTGFTGGLRRNNGNNTLPGETIEYQPEFYLTMAQLFEGYDNILTWNERGEGSE